MPTKPTLRSPWLEQLENTRTVFQLKRDRKTDVAVVGAGIAGVTTAYFLLKHTNKNVLLIEGDRVAHGATGHNAGQLASYFERSFTDIVHEFGIDMAAAGQKAVESSWDLLDDIENDLRLETPRHTFKGFAGCVDIDELTVHLSDHRHRTKAGLPVEPILVAETSPILAKIPRTYKSLYKTVPHATILDLLQTKDHRYVAVVTGKKGVLNSARFCEEIIGKLVDRYPRRFTLTEHTPIRTVTLYRRHAELISKACTIRAKRVVLCTNGFERLHIQNRAGANIDVKFHHLVRGSVGYMAAFTEEPQMAPTAVSYLPSRHKHLDDAYDSEPYVYLTRRPYGDDGQTSLVCVGGPEALMDDTNNYSVAHPYPAEAKKMIDGFVQKTYRHSGHKLKYTHLWHGLMGYTPNGIRCVGAEPCNPVLLYNLGCNGVGILPSVYGSSRIASIIRGDQVSPSIFDPADIRCVIDEPANEKNDAFPYRRIAIWAFIAVWVLAMGVVLGWWWMGI